MLSARFSTNPSLTQSPRRHGCISSVSGLRARLRYISHTARTFWYRRARIDEYGTCACRRSSQAPGDGSPHHAGVRGANPAIMALADFAAALDMTADAAAAMPGQRIDHVLPVGRGRADALSLHIATFELIEALLIGIAAKCPTETVASLQGHGPSDVVANDEQIAQGKTRK